MYHSHLLAHALIETHTLKISEILLATKYYSKNYTQQIMKTLI